MQRSSSCWLVTVLNRNVVKPVQRLSLALNDFASGRMNVSVAIDGDEEIRLLGKNFNDMVRKINALMDEVKAEEAAKNNARVQALSMQISLHFIYNTLNSIKWIAEMNKQENIRRMLQADQKDLHPPAQKGGRPVRSLCGNAFGRDAAMAGWTLCRGKDRLPGKV
jgi:two-component system sensor histidine kinase YesM